MEYQDNLKIIEKLLSKEALLCQLAEEAAELAEAIYIYMEAKRKSNSSLHTMICFIDTENMEWKGVVEEAADVSLVITTVLERLYDEKDMKIYESLSDTMRVAVKQLRESENINAVQKIGLELARGALKLKRAMSDENPTPITEDDARNTLLCKVSVANALFEALFGESEKEEILKIKIEKAERWSKRLRGEVDDEGIYKN